MARGGFPGMGNMNNLMKQAQMLQKQMAEMQEEISNTVFEGNANGDLVVAQVNGKKVLISAGPTIAPIDPVRFITNRSTGKMGYSIAGEVCIELDGIENGCHQE